MSKPIASAELNQAGQLTRQYIYLADMPIAVIDTPQGKPLSNEELSAHVLLGLDAQNILKYLWQGITGSDGNEQTAWLHVNHLGAPEAVTDSEGQLIWQASYAPFGAAKIIKASAGKSNDSSQFTLNLRLPGQYFDAETGLFYNKHRYYDPARGEYLTPDPLGAPDGPNGYSYVRYNPLKYVDPDGLILFAFDGTGNSDNPSDPAMANNGSSATCCTRKASQAWATDRPTSPATPTTGKTGSSWPARAMAKRHPGPQQSMPPQKKPSSSQAFKVSQIVDFPHSLSNSGASTSVNIYS